MTAIVVSFVFASLATVAVGLRFYVRRWMRKLGLLPEDWFIFAALVCRNLELVVWKENEAADFALGV